MYIKKHLPFPVGLIEFFLNNLQNNNRKFMHAFTMPGYSIFIYFTTDVQGRSKVHYYMEVVFSFFIYFFFWLKKSMLKIE